MTALKNKTPDLFEGVFNNRATGCREVYSDGRLRRYARKNCVGISHPNFGELAPAWGTYPDLPAHLAIASEAHA